MSEASVAAMKEILDRLHRGEFGRGFDPDARLTVAERARSIEGSRRRLAKYESEGDEFFASAERHRIRKLGGTL